MSTLRKRITPEILRDVEENLRTAELGYRLLTMGKPPLKLPGLRNIVVFGRTVTWTLQNLRSTEKGFDAWYAKYQKEMSEDPYVKALLELCHTDPLNRFLDRLLLASVIECRGAERFRLVSAALEHDVEFKAFYHQLWVSEAKHGNIFVRMALNYFEKDRVYSRLQELNEAEGKIIQSLELRAALH